MLQKYDLDFIVTFQENPWLELHKDVLWYFEQIFEAAPYKRPTYLPSY